MHSSNPYAQGGWPNTRNPLSMGQSYWDPRSPHSPTFGALPAASSIGSPNSVTFHFNSPTSDTLNCAVMSNQQKIFDISTSSSSPKVTTFSTPDGRLFATVEWLAKPLVTVAGRVPKQDATKWISFTRDRKTAAMVLGGDMYAWVFHGEIINLYKSDSNPPERLAKLYWNNGLHLDVNVSAIQNGFLEVFVVAASLLQSRQESISS